MNTHHWSFKVAVTFALLTVAITVWNELYDNIKILSEIANNRKL